jgi:predicted nucleic acid-binding protein
MYVDSCIFVKLLTPEPNSIDFSRYCVGKCLHTSELSWTEVFSALLSKERAGRISTESRKRAWRRFGLWVDQGSVVMMTLNRTSLNKANLTLTQCHPEIPLRTQDAIHLAAADLSQQFPLITTDGRMIEAAKKLKMPFFDGKPTGSTDL